MESGREEHLKTKAVLLLFRAHSNLLHGGRSRNMVPELENLVNVTANGSFFAIVENANTIAKNICS